MCFVPFEEVLRRHHLQAENYIKLENKTPRIRKAGWSCFSGFDLKADLEGRIWLMTRCRLCRQVTWGWKESDSFWWWDKFVSILSVARAPRSHSVFGHTWLQDAKCYAWRASALGWPVACKGSTKQKSIVPSHTCHAISRFLLQGCHRPGCFQFKRTSATWTCSVVVNAA